MRRFGIFCFNIIIAVAAGTLFTFVIGFRGLSRENLMAAFLQSGFAGLLVGATVGIGATIGPRPPLHPKKCVIAQAIIVVTSLIGAFLGRFFPREFAAADQVIEEQLARQGIVLGSWIGAAIGTAAEVVHTYFMRRRAGPRRD